MDNTAPGVTISGVPATSDAPFTATFTFLEAVTGFAVGDITLGNGTASSFTVTSTTVYTALVTPTAAGTVTVDVAANAAQDAAGNGNTAATRASSTYTVTASLPAITIVAGTSPVAEGTSAVFTLSRTGSPAAALTVRVRVSETGGDMVAAANEGARTVTFLANSATATLSVVTVPDSVGEANGVVTATVSADTGSPASYSVDTPASAMVTVEDNDTAIIIGPVVTGGGGAGGGGGPSPSEVDFEWTVEHDIEELGSGHDTPTGMWSDGATVWLLENGDGADDAVYAYDLATGERVEDREFELDERNRAPRGVWSDRTTIWVSDSGQDRLFAHDLATGERLSDRDLVLAGRNADPRGIWSDDTTMWVLDGTRNALFAYDFESAELLDEYALDSANDVPHGIWSDGVTVWASDHGGKRLFAYRLPAPEGPAAEDAEPQDLEHVRDEEFPDTVLSRAGNNSPRGIWSDGDVMYVADESGDRVFSYNMPDAIDARLASLTLSGIDIGEFSPGRTDYEGSVAEGVTETTVEAEAMLRRTDVAIDPPDADGDDANGHQVALRDLGEITVTVTSQDGSRTKVYRVRFPETGWDPVRDPWPHCLRGAVSEGLSLVVYEGDSVEELVSCAESRGVVALYALHGGVYLSYILGAPGFVNRGFVATFAGGVSPVTPLVVRSDGPPSPDPFGDDLEGDGQQPWPECVRGAVSEGLSLVVYEGGSREELVVCARSMEFTALYALHEGVYLSYILGAPAFVNQPFGNVFADGLPFMTPLVARSEGQPGGR